MDANAVELSSRRKGACRTKKPPKYRRERHRPQGSANTDPRINHVHQPTYTDRHLIVAGLPRGLGKGLTGVIGKFVGRSRGARARRTRPEDLWCCPSLKAHALMMQVASRNISEGGILDYRNQGRGKTQRFACFDRRVRRALRGCGVEMVCAVAVSEIGSMLRRSLSALASLVIIFTV